MLNEIIKLRIVKESKLLAQLDALRGTYPNCKHVPCSESYRSAYIQELMAKGFSKDESTTFYDENVKV